MEHSLLHAVQLLGLLSSLGGALFFLLILKPALSVSQDAGDGRWLGESTARFVMFAALISAGAGVANIFVQVAELEGATVYQGVALTSIKRYLLETTVGRLNGGRIGLLMLAAVISLTRVPGKWFLFLATTMGAALLGTFVSHAAALPIARSTAVVAQIFHITAGALWFGMLVQLWRIWNLLRHQNSDSSSLEREIVRRFSPFGLIGVALLAISGLYLAYRFLKEPIGVVFSAYGITLLLKLCLLSFAVFAGYQNWRVIRPAILRQTTANTPTTDRFRKLIELEVSAGTIVIILAAIVGSISPPGVDGSARVNTGQVQAIFSPEFPPTRFIDPALFVGAEARTVQDLRYSEFTHRWSGVLVIMLALLWLGQSMGGEAMKKFCGWGWPVILVPFGFFVAIFADPEPWLTRNLSWTEMFQSPEIIEHQLGALLVFLLVAFGFRDRKREALFRPLGFVLPAIIIFGSIMLLGHAHSNVRTSEELGSLINFQHAVLGGFALIAGFVRWLQLRDIFSGGWARVVWPAGIMLLGVGMAFFYTELT